MEIPWEFYFIENSYWRRFRSWDNGRFVSIQLNSPVSQVWTDFATSDVNNSAEVDVRNFGLVFNNIQNGYLCKKRDEIVQERNFVGICNYFTYRVRCNCRATNGVIRSKVEEFANSGYNINYYFGCDKLKLESNPDNGKGKPTDFAGDVICPRLKSVWIFVRHSRKFPEPGTDWDSNKEEIG